MQQQEGLLTSGVASNADSNPSALTTRLPRFSKQWGAWGWRGGGGGWIWGGGVGGVYAERRPNQCNNQPLQN